MYARRFDSAPDPSVGITIQEDQPPASPKNDATHDVNAIPPTTTRKDNDFPSANLFGDDDKHSEELTAMPTSLEELHKLYRQKMAMLFAVASDSQNLKKVVDSNTRRCSAESCKGWPT